MDAQPELTPPARARKRNKSAVWIAVAFAVVVLGAIVVSTFRTQPYRCRVCITFNGRMDCRTASGQSRLDAQRTATVAACAQISGGVIESGQCENTPPTSLDWLQ